jgi:hypothetical protein
MAARCDSNQFAGIHNAIGPAKFNFKNRRKKVRKILILLLCILGLAVGATAQEDLNFATLPQVSIPTPMPNGYGQLNWNNILFVTPNLWVGSGPGFKDGPVGHDVAFIGGKICQLVQEACYGTISSAGGPTGFQAVSATVAGGSSSTISANAIGASGQTNMIVFAYNNGNFVGSASYKLSTQMQTVNFPSSWGSVTQLTFQTAGGGDLVFYDLKLFTLGG